MNIKQNACVLVVDDEPNILELVNMTLDRIQIACCCAKDLRSAKKLLATRQFDLCLTDMRLPDGDGLEFVSYIQQRFPTMPVTVITAHGSIETAIRALKQGAFDFLTKPIDLSVLRVLVNNALQLPKTEAISAKQLIGKSKLIEETRKTINKLARSQVPVYISGESGVGKELVARILHKQGPRAAKPFVPVNCGAIPHDLVESEFFGYKKGSFTGAHTDKEGLFQAAHEGTLFLDEVAELSQSMQVKLLRAIQEKCIRPVGSQREIPVNIRILSATNKDLLKLAERGSFRQDLFYRINVIELPIPPLRQRTEDIPDLVHHILERLCKEGGIQHPKIADENWSALATYHYPGNVRELENILERAITLCDNNTINAKDLQLTTSKLQEAGQKEGIEEQKEAGLDSYLSEIEKETILKALEKTRWNKTATAKLLGISFRTLRYRLEKLGLN